MVRLEIDLDQESAQILTELAEEHEGNLSAALSELLRSHKAVEEFVEDSQSVPAEFTDRGCAKRRQEWRHGTHECVRHLSRAAC